MVLWIISGGVVPPPVKEVIPQDEGEMKRDIEMLRGVLVALETLDPKVRAQDVADVMDEEEDRVARVRLSEIVEYYLSLLEENKLVAVEVIKTGHGDKLRLFTLTDLGCDVLECIRDDVGWKKLKDVIASLGKPITTSNLVSAAKAFLEVDVRSEIGRRKKDTGRT